MPSPRRKTKLFKVFGILHVVKSCPQYLCAIPSKFFLGSFLISTNLLNSAIRVEYFHYFGFCFVMDFFSPVGLYRYLANRATAKLKSYCSYFDLFLLGLDLLWREKRAAITAGAKFRHLFPTVCRFDITLPERPGTALDRPGLVHLARSFLRVKKTTVAMIEFNKRLPKPGDLTHKRRFKLKAVKPHLGGDLLNFRLRDPNVSRLTGSTTTALLTLKLQTGLIPRHGKGVRGESMCCDSKRLLIR